MSYPIEALTKAYIGIREERAKLLKDFEAKDTELKEQLTMVESEILTFCKTSGIDSVKTRYGTASRTIRERYWCTDWDEFKKFVKENDALELFEKRIQQGNMKSLIEINPELRPPGMNIDREFSITVRKAK